MVTNTPEPKRIGFLMHWIIQENIFKPENARRLIEVLDRYALPWTAVTIPRSTFEIEPDIRPEGKVYVCGAVKMAEIARRQGWAPGSFLNDHFDFALWQEKLGDELLNHSVEIGKLGELSSPRWNPFFIRPAEDNKAFDGQVMDAEHLDAFRRDPRNQSLLSLSVVVAPIRNILREQRLFVVGNKLVTGSVYKLGGKPYLSQMIEDDVLQYARHIIQTWIPAESCVIDIARVDEGLGDNLRVIEFNNINSSGFYAADVAKYVEAVELEYGDL